MRKKLIALFLVVVTIPGIVFAPPTSEEKKNTRSTGRSELLIGGVVAAVLGTLAIADYVDLIIESRLSAEKCKVIKKLMWEAWPGVLRNDEGWDYIKRELDRGNYRLVLQTAAAYALPVFIAFTLVVVLGVKACKALFGKKEVTGKKTDRKKK